MGRDATQIEWFQKLALRRLTAPIVARHQLLGVLQEDLAAIADGVLVDGVGQRGVFGEEFGPAAGELGLGELGDLDRGVEACLEEGDGAVVLVVGGKCGGILPLKCAHVHEADGMPVD